MLLFRSETPLARGLAPIHPANAALAASASHSGSVKGAVLRTHLIREVVLVVPPERTSKQTVLLNRRILVGICGGIASYKAVELISHLQQAGALVDVIMSEHAEEFIRPLTFSTMSHRPVYSDLWEPSGRAAETHIALAQDAELLAVIPATANTIAKLA